MAEMEPSQTCGFRMFDVVDTQVAQRSKALHISARVVTTDRGSIPGCITTGYDWESRRAAHNWPSIVRVRGWPSL